MSDDIPVVPIKRLKQSTLISFTKMPRSNAAIKCDTANVIDDEQMPSTSSDLPREERVLQDCGGTDLSDMNRNPVCRGSQLERFRKFASPNHTVLIDVKSVNLSSGDQPKPYPNKYKDSWDASHVRLPCSEKNVYPIENDNNMTAGLENRWLMIEKALLREYGSTLDLEEAILSYNSRYRNRWKFRGLHFLFNEVLESIKVDNFFAETLPAMARLALRLPLLITQPIPLLKQHNVHCVTLSQQQIACLLANAFFCTFPRRNAAIRRNNVNPVEYENYPDINFNRLFSSPSNAQKIQCLIHYFTRVCDEMPTGVVSFERRGMTSFPDWALSNVPLCKLHVSAKGTIEDFGDGMLQVDFANCFLGGGVLNHGCERFSYYSGYADTFMWTGDFCDKTPRDPWGRIECEVVAIDALCFNRFGRQFEKHLIDRELNKAYVGFQDTRPADALSAVATGNWGCGAFGGDKYLKSLVQLLSTSVANRDMVYFTFGDFEFVDQLILIHQFLDAKKLTVGDVYVLLVQFCDRIKSLKTSEQRRMTLFEFIKGLYSGDLSDNSDAPESPSFLNSD